MNNVISNSHHHQHSHPHSHSHSHSHAHAGVGKSASVKPSFREALAEQKEEIVRIIVAALLLGLGIAVEERVHGTSLVWVEYALYLTAYLLVGLEVWQSAVRHSLSGNLFDENFLMAIATLGAIAIHQLPEAVAVMLFYAVGEMFQDLAVNRSRRSISALLDIRPDKARLKNGDHYEMVSPEQVQVGATIVVHPGERIPLDGVIVEGEAFVDTSALTGESVPRKVGKGDSALAGMVSTNGILSIKVTKPFAESSISRILHLVEDAAERKARTEQVITTFSRYYTPAVVAAAAALAVLPPLLIEGATFSTWLYRALVLLVISCPCALVISVPLSYFGGLGASSRHGILVKGAGYLDALAKLDTVALDKTGTLTKGSFNVTAVQPYNGFSHEELLGAAAKVEAPSAHPIAASIIAAYDHAYDRKVNPQALNGYEEIAGHGVKGSVDGRSVAAGNDRFMHREEVVHGAEVCDKDGTVVHVAIDGAYAGHITIADEVRPEAKETVKALHKLGVRRVAMLTGDDSSVARAVGRELGIDEIHANLLPGDKVARLEALKTEVPAGRSLAFVGDGINDAPVITRADVGIAMGGLGSDAAIEAADVVIMDDHIARLPVAIDIARRTRRIVYQNIAFALGIKSLFMLMGALGVASIWGAVFADVGVSLLTIVNSTRLLGFRPRAVAVS
ncbi:MAG TPA: cadmium-translocating P-type ATPase [Firmicutes bacterium]|nr:cadmium-translocating P-type ATPase [Bacillota bacterium]